MSQISKILDKHADPSVVLPESSVEIDPATDQRKVKLGNAFIMSSKEDVKPEYMTWESELNANFTQIEVLLNQLATISELGTLFIGNGFEKIGNISGVALKKLAYSALAKMNRLGTKLGPAIVKILKLASQISGKDLSKEKITVSFKDGLPNSWQDEVEYVSQAVKAGVMSKKIGISILHEGMDEESINKEYDEIMKDQEAANEGKDKQEQSDDTKQGDSSQDGDE